MSRLFNTAMASASPALHASRPAGWIDPRKLGEYPIILGDSFKSSDSGDQLLNLRYNWQPKSGIARENSKLKSTDDGYRLTVKDTNDSSDLSFVYAGRARASADSSKDGPLALIFDKKASVFKVEVIAKSIDLNLQTTTSKAVNVRKLSKLPKPADRQQGSKDAKDETADPTNPFDFRNFLAEAKENAEKTAHRGGSRTPIPGDRTPMSGFASPVPGASRFKPTTPQFNATSSPAPKRKRTDEASKATKFASPARPKQTQKRKVAEKTREPLSKEKVSDSDDEMSDTIVVQPTSAPLQSKPKGHSRNISSGLGRSPHIVVNDGDLEIDMGSPPQEARGRPGGRIDPGAFRSHTGTPVMGMSSNSRLLPEDVQMRDTDEDHSEDGDIEELELGSPRTNRLSVHGSRSVSVVEPVSSSLQEHAPTPPNQGGDDEDDDLLAAEFEAALEEDDKDAQTADRVQGFGLGITTGAAQKVDEDDESEVSEEE